MANKKVSQLVSKPSVLVTDLFPIADPTTGQLYKTTISDLGTAIGSGVSSVNTLVGAVVLDTDDIQELASPTNRWFTDTRARAALSASSPLAYNSGTGVFSIPAATSSQNGYLTSTDWTTFNAKQAALSGTGFVKISGTTISYDNSTYLTTSAAASTYLALAGGTLTGALNGTSANFSGDLTLTGTNPRFYLTDSDNNPDYFISNTDGTFTVYDVTNSTSRFTIGTTGNGTFEGNLTVGQIIRSGGTSAQFLKADGSVDNSTYLTTSSAASTYVDLTNNQTIIGIKTFISMPILNEASTVGGEIIYTTTSKQLKTIGDFRYNDSTGVLRTKLGALGTNAYSSTDYLPLAGGTMTGAIVGTSATFAMSGSGVALEATGSGTGDAIKITHSSGRAFTLNSSGSGFGILINNDTAATSAPFTIQKQGGAVITLTDAGGGTFASSVRSSGYYLTGMTSGSGALYYSSGANRVTVANYNTNGIVLFEVNGGSAALTLNADLSATFASTLNATGATLTGALSGTTATFSDSTTMLRFGNLLRWGFQRPAADNRYVSFMRNMNATATPVYTIDGDNGNVGIGLTSLVAKLHVENASSADPTSLSSVPTTNIFGMSTSPGGMLAAGIGTTGGTHVWLQGRNVGGAGVSYPISLQPLGGNVGIGTTAPNINGGAGYGTTLTILASSAYGGLEVYGAGATNGGQLDFGSGSTRFASISGEYESSDNGFINIRTRRAGAMTDAVRISSSGHVLFGTTGTSWTNTVGCYIFYQSAVNITRNGAEAMTLNRLTSDGEILRFFRSGTQVGNISVTTSATSYNTSSDYRLKEDLKPINGLEIVNKIKVYDYKWKASDSRMDGVLAHELAEVLPYAVNGVKDGEQMQGVDYSKIVPVMVQAIKELKAELDTLKNK